MRIAGLDEVGRGCLAGPLVACGAILNSKSEWLTLKDSKKLNPKQRKEFNEKLLESEIEFVIEEISVELINQKGIGWANKEIFERIIKKIQADKYIVDGNLKLTVENKNIVSVIKADNTRKCVMAAAIVAKVYRDSYMEKLHDNFPEYEWSSNKGYGTRKHIEALKKLGATEHHREIFVRTALSNLTP